MSANAVSAAPSTSGVGGAAGLSPAALEQLATQLQTSLPKQTGTLILDHSGTVLAASGDLKESADRVARLLLTMLQDVNGIFVHSTKPAANAAGSSGAERDELAKVTVAFKSYEYAISLTNQLVLCVKTNVD
jgi:hypothetical protein